MQFCALPYGLDAQSFLDERAGTVISLRAEKERVILLERSINANYIVTTIVG